MPILTRTLESVEQSAGGTVLASFFAVDAKSRPWRRSPSRFADETAAVVASDAFDWEPQLKDKDFQELFDWVLARNTVVSFDLVGRDITEQEGEDFIAITFSESPGDHAMQLSWWIESLNPTSWTAIRTRIGWTSQEGSDVQDKGIALNTAEPFYDVIIEAP